MKFSIKNCLTAFKNLIMSINCCNSKCLNQTVAGLDEATIHKINEIQEQLEEAWAHIHELRASHGSTSTYI